MKKTKANMKKTKANPVPLKHPKEPCVVIPKEEWEEVLKVCVNAENEVNYLQEQLEILTFKLKDITDELKLRHEEHVANNDEVINAKIKNDAHTYQINQLNLRINTLQTENEQLKTSKVNTEHLAKKVLELQKEMSRTTMSYCPFQRHKRLNPDPTQQHQLCGVCIACQLDKVTEDLIKNREYSLKLESDFNHQNKEIVNLKIEQKDLYNIINMQRDALELIARGSFFKHASIAHASLNEVMKYKDKNGII
jgi:uncharacterized small protein (DUF1192 family)